MYRIARDVIEIGQRQVILMCAAKMTATPLGRLVHAKLWPTEKWNMQTSRLRPGVLTPWRALAIPHLARQFRVDRPEVRRDSLVR